MVRPAWHAVALCIGQTDLFFSPEPADQLAAELICAVCPARVPCLAAALANNEPDGVWGGYTTRERRAIVARLRRHAVPA